MKLDLQRFQETYLLESISKTVSVGTWASWLSIPILIGFGLQDYLVLGLEEVWIWRLIGLIPFLIFLVYRYSLAEQYPRWVLFFNGFNILGVQLMMAGICYVVLSDPSASLQNQYAVSIGLVSAMFASLLIAGVSRYFLYVLVPTMLVGTSLAVVLTTDVPLTRLSFMSNGFITGTLIVFFARFHQKNQLREFALRKTLEVRETELAAQKAHLEQVNQDLESFSYTVSHDLKSPLRNLIGLSTLLKRKLKLLSAAPELEMADALHLNAQKMNHLVEDILAFSRAGQSSINVRQLEMTEMFRSVYQELQKLEKGRNVTFHLENLPPAVGDPALIRQVINNLLSNALKYTRNRPVAEIWVKAEATDGGAVYVVQDNGAGFDEQWKDKLFTAFQRLHDDADFEGNGVGLSFVYKIIQRHEGRIWAQGKPDQGAAFYFTLPMQSLS